MYLIRFLVRICVYDESGVEDCGNMIRLLWKSLIKVSNLLWCAHSISIVVVIVTMVMGMKKVRFLCGTDMVMGTGERLIGNGVLICLLWVLVMEKRRPCFP